MLALFIGSFWPSFWPILLLQQVFALMLSWWFGALLADTFTKRISISFIYLTPLAIGLIPGLFFAFPSTIINDTFCAIGFVGILSICFASLERGRTLAILNQLKWLGDCSYTLYVIHFPLIVLFSGWLMWRDPLLPSHFGFVWLGIIGSVLIAYAIHFLVEKPFTSAPAKKRSSL